MWKFFVYGAVVQIVLLVAMLDVFIYQEDEQRYLSVFGWHFRTNQEPCQLTIFFVDGLQSTDMDQALEGWHLMRLVESTNGNESVTFNYTYRSLTAGRKENDSRSIIDGKRIFYAGASSVDEFFNVTSWHTVYINCSDVVNMSDPLSVNANYNDRVIQSFERYLDSSDFLNHPVRLLRFDVRNCDFNSTSPKIRKRSVRHILDGIHNLLKKIEKSSSNATSMLVTTSSLRTLSLQVDKDEGSKDFLAVWVAGGHPDPSHCEETISYNEAYSLLGTVINSRYTRVIRHEISFTLKTSGPHWKNSSHPLLFAEGNLLGFFGMDPPKVTQPPPGYPSTFVDLPRLVVLNEVFTLLDYSNVEIDAVVILASILLFCSWMCLLVVKAVNLGSEVEEYGKLPTATVMRILNAAFLVILVFIWALMAYWEYPIRYTVYLFAAILTTRWFLDALLLLVRNTSTISVPSPMKVCLLVGVTLVIVELFFWTARYGQMYVLFTTLIAIRILMEAFSTANLRTEVSLAVSTCCVGLALIVRALKFEPVITVNVTAVCWIIAGGLAIKFLMRRLNFERIVMSVCLAEYVICALISNLLFLWPAKDIHDSTMVAVLCTLMIMNLLLPTLGNPANRQCRLLQMSVATSSFFLFFAPECEGLVFLTVFTTCICIYKLEIISQPLNNDDLVLSPFMVLLYSVILAMSAQAIAPIGGKYLFQAESLVAMGVSCNIVAVIVVYYIKLGFLVNVLQMTVLSCVKKFLETSTLLLIIAVFNLVSLR
ncbi:Hypothetical protein NTJ_06630 [Nesidiocoris tenuis]|nr:Hypothetical protein NTJ_06630 [Nesidiocoris tenuis]